MRRPFLLVAAASAAFVLGACGGPANTSSTPNTTSSPVPTSSPVAVNSPTVANPDEAALQQLVGKWGGPEGTYISIADKKGADGKNQAPRKFDIEIKNLDKAEKFEGTAKGSTIEFTRKGKTETVKSATGAETGMKGYEKETGCVVVTKGSEGFCKKEAVATAPATSPAASPAVSPAKK